jgi:hypothetical protein
MNACEMAAVAGNFNFVSPASFAKLAAILVVERDHLTLARRVRTFFENTAGHKSPYFLFPHAQPSDIDVDLLSLDVSRTIYTAMRPSRLG